jgi:hypothetical protein
MIFVERDEPAPGSLSAPAAVAEANRADQYYNGWKPGDPAFETFTQYRGSDVHEALRRMFKWKCAYCESQLEKGSFEVEHYRPKGGIAGCNEHPGYWWLALKWENLLPTCAPCNKGLLQHVVTADMTVEQVEALQAKARRSLMGKATQFPVGAARLEAKSEDHFAEDPHLIDPTRTDPEPLLNWRHDSAYSVVEAANSEGGQSVLGDATINCVALNRIDLVVKRTEILERLRVQRIKILEDLESDALGAGDPAVGALHLVFALRRIEDMKLSCAEGQPFAGMARAFVKKFTDELNQWATANGFGGA